MLAACSNSGQPAGNLFASTAGLRDASAARRTQNVPIVFASTLNPASVYAFSDAGSFPQLWVLTGAPLKYPGGLALDAQGNLYVSDSSGSVFEYDTPSASGAPGQPNFTYQDPGHSPVRVAACAPYVYAADATGSLTVWEAGSSTPLRVVSAGAGATGLACDGAHVYVGYDVSYAGPGQLVALPAGGAGQPDVLPFSTAFVQGVGLNPSGTTLLIGDSDDPKGIRDRVLVAPKSKLSSRIVAPWSRADRVRLRKGREGHLGARRLIEHARSLYAQRPVAGSDSRAGRNSVSGARRQSSGRQIVYKTLAPGAVQ